MQVIALVADRSVGVAARVQHDYRDARRDRLGDRCVHDARVVVRYGDAADVGVDGVLDLRVLRVVIRLGLALLLGPIDLAQLTAQGAGRVLGALVDQKMHMSKKALVALLGVPLLLITAWAR